ncbi:MAG: class I SAM-dependent methyltransferase [Verrucomicrobiota bacterium]
MSKLISFLGRLAKITCRNPADLVHVMGMANAAAMQIENPDSDVRIFPQVDYSEIPGENCRFSVQMFPGVGASVSLIESAALAAMIKLANAKSVFEFGTYKGVSTTQIALNLPDDGVVHTLDLPEDHPVYISYSKLEPESSMKSVVPQDQAHKVKYLKADSAEFDTTPYRGKMDLVFVDGYHSYEYVKNDTEKGLEMLRPGGIIAWHDCEAGRPEVVRYLKSLTPLPKLVASTFLAYSVKPS